MRNGHKDLEGSYQLPAAALRYIYLRNGYNYLVGGEEEGRGENHSSYYSINGGKVDLIL